MNTRRHNVMTILATGVVVLVLVCLGLFWLRWLCSVQRGVLLPQAARDVVLPLSHGELKREGTEDPNGPVPYVLAGGQSPMHPFLAGLGVLHYVQSRMPWLAPDSPVYRWDPGKPESLRVYYDASLGKIVYQGIEESRREDGTDVPQYVTRYAGPEGIAETPDEKLGRFLAPIADRYVLKPQIVYDRAARRFFAIGWSEQTVHKGPELPSDDSHHPVQIRVLRQIPSALHVGISPNPRDEARRLLSSGYFLSLDRVLILDASGRIDLLNPQTLEFAGVAGGLPTPRTLFDSHRPGRLGDIAAYDVMPFSVSRPGTGKERSYGGLAAASLSRDGLTIRLAVYDPNGRNIAAGDTEIQQHTDPPAGPPRTIRVSSAEAAYFRLPGAQALTVTQFALENLHPPVLLLLSYLAAPHVGATAGYRSLFLLPDSFVAMAARDGGVRLVERISLAVLLASGTIVFVSLLAWRVDRHGVRTGLSKQARTAWRVGVLVFGLPAYITYRLTWPKITLVTCANCGQGRRPDTEKCHHCGSPWVVPELTPPAWRVIGEPEPADESAPSQAPQASSPTE